MYKRQVFALPFVAIIVQEWLKARADGADEGNKGVLSAARIENRVFVAIVVVCLLYTSRMWIRDSFKAGPCLIQPAAVRDYLLL